MRTRRTKEQIRKDIYNKDVDAYNFYVVNLDTMKAETGFEFKEDAVDVLNDYDDKKKYKVVSKKALKSLGVENPNESFKYEAGGDFQSGVYAGGGGVKINTEVILSENRPNGAEWQGVVKPFMLKSIEENQYAGGFKRYEIDIYDEVDREPTKEEIKKANEFFDKIGGRYAGGGNVKPFEYKENNSTIIINGTKADVKKMYLDYKNNFLSVRKFAEHYNISETQANSIIESGRKYAKEDGYYARGGKVLYKDLFEDYENQPEELKEIVNFYEIKWEKADYDYKDSFNFQKEVETIGYTFNYGLDNEPFALRKKDVKLNQVIGYKDMDTKNDMIFAKGGEFMTDPTFGNFQNNVYADGGVTNNYVPRRNLNTITIKKGNQKLTYKISDVLNGAYKLESGAKLEDIAFYVPKRSIVKVQLKTGKDFKPANGYWIKDGAKPIHISKFDDGGEIKFSNGGGFGEVAFIITNDYYGNLELGFHTITINEQYISANAFMTYSDAMKRLIDLLKSEDGEYIIKNDPKSKFQIEMVSYNPKLDKYKDLEPQRKILYSIKASMINDFTKKSIFNEGGSIEKSILKITPITTKRDSKGFRFYSDNTGNKLFAEKDNKIYNVNDDLKVIGEVPLQRVRFVIEGIISDEDVKNLEPLHYEAKTIKRVREQFVLKNKYNEGGVMSRLLTRKKDQPKVETTDEDIDLNEDSRIRVRPSTFVSKDKEGDWMMKKNSSKEARSYAGGGNVNSTDDYKLMRENKIVLLQGNPTISGQILARKNALKEIELSEKAGESDVYPSMLENWKKNHNETIKKLEKLKKSYFGGGKVTFSEKAKAIAKNFEGKRVEPKYQKEYGKVYDKDEAKEVGNKIAGSQKASYDAKLEKGSEVKKGKGNHKMKATTDLARKIRKDGEKWTDAIKRASLQLK